MSEDFRELRLTARALKIIAWLVLALGLVSGGLLVAGTLVPGSGLQIGIGILGGVAVFLGALTLFAFLYTGGALCLLMLRIEADAKELAVKLREGNSEARSSP